MPQIVDKTYFSKSNFLYIPLSVAAPVSNPSTQTPDNVQYIDNLCIEIEKDLLLKAFGVDMYNELQLALADIDNPLNANYKKLVQGEFYNSKQWKGLNHDLSLIACKIYSEFIMRTNNRLSGVGMVKVSPEKADLSNPNSAIVRANQMFINQYQDRALFEPKVENNTLDWLYFENDLEVSLHRYLNDKAVDFPLWQPSYFRLYRNGIVNEFGL